MQDDENKKEAPENIPGPEDLESEDFEEDFLDEEIGEEPWDEFDDDFEASLEDDGGLSGAAQGQKTFVQKYFVLIVIGIVVVLAGLAGLGLMSGGTKDTPGAVTDEQTLQTAQEQQDLGALNDIQELGESSDMPPMPAPINTSPETETGQSDDVLTPMPGPEKAQNGQADEMDLSGFDFTTLPEEEDDKPAGTSAQSDTGDAAEDPAKADNSETDDFAQLMGDMKGSDEPAAAGSSTAAQPSEEKAQAVSPQVQEEENQTPGPQIENRLSSLESEMETVNTALEDIQTSLAALQGAVEQLDTSRQNAKTGAKQSENSENRVSRVKTPKKPPQRPEIKWILRAAQPGKAIIAPEGTNRFRNIETGDTVNGLGKITSIAIENGRWVVRGTNGQITQ